MSSKTKLIGILLVLTLFLANITPIIALQEDFDVFSENTGLHVCSCSFTKNTLSIRNTGDVTSVYALQQEGDATPWSTLTQHQFTLKPGQEEQFLNYVRVPCDSEGEYTLATKINTLFGLEKSIEQQVDVRTCQNININANALSQATCPCSPIAYEFTIFNSGDHVETYSFSVTPFDDHLSLSTQQATIDPGKSTTVAVFITKPCAVYGDFPYLFRAVGEGSNVVGEIPFDLHINQCYDYAVDVPGEVVVCNNFENIISLRLRNAATIANAYRITASLANDGQSHYEPVFLFGKQEQLINLTIPINDLDVKPYTLQVGILPERGTFAQEREITLYVEECDDQGSPIIIEQEERNLAPFLIGIAVLLLILLLLGWYAVRRGPTSPYGAVPAGRSAKKVKEGQDTLARLRKWLIAIVLILILVGLVFAGLLVAGVIPFGVFNETNESLMEDEDVAPEEFIEEETIGELPLEEEISEEELMGEELDEQESARPALWVYLLVIGILILIILIILGIVVWCKKSHAHVAPSSETMYVQSKKEKRIFITSAKSKRWIWFIFTLLIIVGVVAGGYYLYSYFSPKNTAVVVDTTGLETRFGAVVVKQGEALDIPLVMYNDDEIEYTIDFTIEREWLTSDTRDLTVASGEEAVVFLTAQPDDTIPTGRYAFNFTGEDEDGYTFTDVVRLEVQSPEASFLSSYLWFIVAAVVLIVMLLLAYFFRKKRRLKRLLEGIKARVYLPPHSIPETKSTVLPATIDGLKPERSPSAKKKWLFFILGLLVLAALIAGVYYAVFADKGALGIANGDLLEEQGLLEDGESFEETSTVDVGESEETLNNVLEIGGEKTVVPIRVKNTNELITYRINVQEDVDWVSVTEDHIRVEPKDEHTFLMVVDPRQGVRDGQYQIVVDVDIESQEEPLFTSTITLNVQKYRWLDSLLSYLFYIVLGLAILFVAILLVRHRDVKSGRIKPKEKGLPTVTASEGSLFAQAENETKAKKGKTQIKLK